jgi:hypothetical protein
MTEARSSAPSSRLRLAQSISRAVLKQHQQQHGDGHVPQVKLVGLALPVGLVHVDPRGPTLLPAVERSPEQGERFDVGQGISDHAGEAGSVGAIKDAVSSSHAASHVSLSP